MDDVARWSATQRRDLFNETAARRGISSVVIEKDFWVCWVLKRLFGLGSDLPGLIFKGGTSLSKVFGLIGRFSEDVDLSLNREEMGFGGDRDPEPGSSKKVRERRVEALRAACETYVEEQLLPRLAADFALILGGPGAGRWNLTKYDSDDPTLVFEYPQSLPQDSYGLIVYVPPVVKLEFGARSEHWPANKYPVTPYAAEVFPDQFGTRSVEVLTIEAKRTFWEKVVLLHEMCHTGRVGNRRSRHFYDVAMIARSPTRVEALANVALLSAVVDHNTLFFDPSARARYDLARPGTFRLVPDEPTLGQLATDYASMRDMFFDDPPSFTELTAELKRLESEINAL